MAPRGEQADRLDFARWLVGADNPLTPRVTVNRVWQRYFGTGLVATENDFGTQGDAPTHPELLDWLAGQFMAGGWSHEGAAPADRHQRHVSAVVADARASWRRPILTTSCWAGSSGCGSRPRAFATWRWRPAALLSDEIGGPGVYPPQPEGIYRFTQQEKFWGESKDDDRYRRGMYTYLLALEPLSVSENVRRAGRHGGLHAPAALEHAAASADAGQRSGVLRDCPRLCRAHCWRRRRRMTRRGCAWHFASAWRASRPARSCRR